MCAKCKAFVTDKHGIPPFCESTSKDASSSVRVPSCSDLRARLLLVCATERPPVSVSDALISLQSRNGAQSEDSDVSDFPQFREYTLVAFFSARDWWLLSVLCRQ